MTKPTGNPTGRPKGQAKSGGRKKGTPNKTTALLKDKRYPGLEKYLVWLSAEYPVAFTSLPNRVLPLQIGGTTDERDDINTQINFTEPPKVIEHQPRFVYPER